MTPKGTQRIEIFRVLKVSVHVRVLSVVHFLPAGRFVLFFQKSTFKGKFVNWKSGYFPPRNPFIDPNCPGTPDGRQPDISGSFCIIFNPL